MPNPIKYSDLVQPDNSIEQLISELRELIGVYDEAKQKIQSAAGETAKQMQSLSGATEEQRKQIDLLTEESDKLVKSYRDVNSAQWKATEAFELQKQAKRESSQIDKLITEINNSQEGSYKRLSAQYRLNKIRLNEMSEATRKETEEGRKLEQETAALYAKMNELQKATGKYVLQVGNYEIAGKSLRGELRDLTQQMAILKANGQQNSEEYIALSQRAATLKDAMNDVNREISAGASDTRALDSAMGAASAASGGMSAMVALSTMFGAASKDATEAQKALGLAVGVVSGLTVVQNQLQKESALMTGIRTIQTKALTRAEKLEAAQQGKNVIVTGAATVAQKAFNLVAKANPYVLLAIAVTTVVGALAAFALGAEKATDEQKKLNDATEAWLNHLDIYRERVTRVNDTRIRQLETEIEIAKAEKRSTQEVYDLEDKLMQERINRHNKNLSVYKEEWLAVESNRKKLEQYQNTLYELQRLQAQGLNKAAIDINLDGKLADVDIEDAITQVQKSIDIYGRKVQIAVELDTEIEDIDKDWRKMQAQRQQEAAQTAKQIAKTERDAVRAEFDARIALEKDSYKRERAMIEENGRRKVEDISVQLKTETNLNAKAREALRKQQKSIEQKTLQELQDLDNRYYIANREAYRDYEDAKIAVMAEGAEKERETLRIEYERQIEDLQTQIATNRDLTEKQVDSMYQQILLLGEKYGQESAKLEAKIAQSRLEVERDGIALRLEAVKESSQDYIDLTIQRMEKERQIELAENAALAEELRQDEAAINAKWDAQILKETAELQRKRAEVILNERQELEAGEFALISHNERQKTQFALKQEKERLEELLELDRRAGNLMTEEARKAMKNTIEAIDKEAKSLPYDNLYELLGIGWDSAQQEAFNTALSSIKESLGSIADSWKAAADKAVESANKQVEATQTILNAEIEARAAGYANRVEQAQKDLALAKANQSKALAEQKKAQMAASRLDTITQSSSLVTASANLWKVFSGMGAIGPALAISAIAMMWGSFAAAKIKAKEMTKTEQYGEGTVELLRGGSHASGHDIDLGTKADGTRRRAEGGEFFAVINRRSSRRYRNVIPDVIKSLNDGTFADKYEKANARLSGLALGMIGGDDLTAIGKDVRAIREQGDEVRYTDGQGNTVIRYKNLTRKIKS